MYFEGTVIYWELSLAEVSYGLGSVFALAMDLINGSSVYFMHQYSEF